MVPVTQMHLVFCMVYYGVSELKVMGTLAARIAATDVGQEGTRLSVQDAVDIAESFAFNLESYSVRSDVGSGHNPSS